MQTIIALKKDRFQPFYNQGLQTLSTGVRCRPDTWTDWFLWHDR